MVISKMDIIILTMQAAFKIGFVGIMYMKGKKNHGKKISQFHKKFLTTQKKKLNQIIKIIDMQTVHILGNLEKKDGGKSILIVMFYYGL